MTAERPSRGMIPHYADRIHTARGNPDYRAGANDPNDVVDLFSFEMP